MDKANSRLTPKDLGYRMPAEWESQEAVWMQWPEKYPSPERKHRLNYQMTMEKTWLLMSWELHRHVKVCILVHDGADGSIH